MIKVLTLAILLVLAGCGLRSENSLLQQFARNKGPIVQLFEMQLQDERVVRIAPTFTRLDKDWSWPRENIGFSEKRWGEYRALFERAGVTDGIQLDGNYLFYFVSSAGLGIGGTSRGFVHSPQPPSPLVKSFDNCPRQEGVCFIAVEGQWYIFQWVT